MEQPAREPQPNAYRQAYSAQPAAVNPQQQGNYMPQQYMQYGSQPPQKKSNGAVIGLIIAGVVIVVLLVIIGIFVIKPLLSGNDKEESSAKFSTTERIKEKETRESTTEQTTEEQTTLPYSDNLGTAAPTDFAWIADAQSGSLPGKAIGKDDIIGKWKAEFIFDGVWELVYITIDNDGIITVEPYQINYGEGWESEAGESSYTFNGTFSVGGIDSTGVYGDMGLYSFYDNNGTQYGLGTLTVNSGATAMVYLVRP